MIVEYIIQYKDLWSFLSCCAIIIGIIIALIEINLVRKSAHSQLLMSLYDAWESDSLTESKYLLRKAGSKSEVLRKIEEYGEKQEKEYFIILRVANYFEHIGLLVNSGYLTDKDIESLMGSNVINYYGVYESYSENFKKDNPLYTYVFDNFRDLKNKIKVIRDLKENRSPEGLHP